MRDYAIVTGTGSGIGSATAIRLAADGYGIVGFDIDLDGATNTADQIRDRGGDAEAYDVDVGDGAAVERAVEHVIHAHGPPAVLVNNAGTAVAATLVDTDVRDWDRTLAVNLSGAFHTCRVVLPAMIDVGRGTVVNVASVAGMVGIARRAAYCASKAGLIGLTRAIAVDHATDGIRANAICPGTVATEWVDRMLADAPNRDELRRAMAHRQLDGRMGTPEEVAAGIAFLVSPDARFVNGSAFVMDGGLTAV